MVKHTQTIRSSAVLAAISALGLLAAPAIASNSHEGEAYAEDGGGLEMVAFDRGIEANVGGANMADDCPYWDECSNAVPIVALAEPDPYGPEGELGVQNNMPGGPEGGLELVVFERAAPVDIAGIGLGLKGEPAGHSIGHDGVED